MSGILNSPLPEGADESDLRRRILVAARTLFAERGYASTSLRAIANAVGLTPPALYWLFSSKQAILQALLASDFADRLNAIERQVVGLTPEQRLRQFVRAHVSWTLARSTDGSYDPVFSIRQVESFLGTDQAAQVMAVKQRQFELLSEILSKGVEDGIFERIDINAAVTAILTMCDYLSSWWRPTGRFSTTELAETYADLAQRMVGGDHDHLEHDPGTPAPDQQISRRTWQAFTDGFGGVFDIFGVARSKRNYDSVLAPSVERHVRRLPRYRSSDQHSEGSPE